MVSVQHIHLRICITICVLLASYAYICSCSYVIALCLTFVMSFHIGSSSAKDCIKTGKEVEVHRSSAAELVSRASSTI